MSSSVELPFWPIVSQSYRGAWETMIANRRFLLVSFFAFVFILLLFSSVFIPHVQQSFKPEIKNEFPSFSISALSIFGSLSILYLQWSIYIVCIRHSLGATPEPRLRPQFFNIRAAKLFGYQFLFLVMYFGVNAVGIASAALAFYLGIRWAGWLFVLISVLCAIWTFILLVQTMLVPASIAVDRSSFDDVKAMMRRMKWRFWKTVSLFVSLSFPLIFVQSAFGFIIWKYQLSDIIYSQDLINAFDHLNWYLALQAINHAASTVVGSVCFSQVIAEVYKRFESDLV